GRGDFRGLSRTGDESGDGVARVEAEVRCQHYDGNGTGARIVAAARIGRFARIYETTVRSSRFILAGNVRGECRSVRRCVHSYASVTETTRLCAIGNLHRQVPCGPRSFCGGKVRIRVSLNGEDKFDIAVNH